MLIESIELSGVANFREPVALGPLQPGLNILAQPNEWGKSTVLHALCRALFDKYSSQNEEIRQLRPVGTSLSPRIELCFAAKGDRYRLIKKFLEGRASELSRWNGAAWERTDESDQADQRVRELLGAPPLENRAAKPETWGLIRYLWCRQDEPAAWPCWDGDCGEVTRRKLATVEIDSLMRGVAARLEVLGDEHFTARGAVKRGSHLQVAESEAAAAEAELAELRQRRTDLEELERQFGAGQAELPRLARECLERAAEAAALHAQAEAAELRKRDVDLADAEFRGAEAALLTVRNDRETLARIEVDLVTEEAAQAQHRHRAEERAAAAGRLEEKLEQGRAAAGEREEVRAQRQARLGRLRELLKNRARSEQLARLLLGKSHLEKAGLALQECEERLAALPSLAKNELERGRELQRALAEQRAQLSAAGLSIRLEPLAPAQVLPKADGVSSSALAIAPGTSAKLQAVRTLTLELSGWGRVMIESGAQETAQLQQELAGKAEQLAALLAQAGATSLAEAEARAQEAQQWQARRQVARAELAAHLVEWKTPAAFFTALAKAQAEREQSRALHRFTEEEERCSEISLQVEEEALATAEAANRREEKALAQGAETLRAELENLRAGAAETARQTAGSLGRTQTLREQTTALLARYAGGVETALAEAQTLFVRAEARLGAARRGLPAHAETLAERATRAARAAAEVEAESQRKQREADRLKTVLEERGGEGLYAREAAAEERRDSARLRAAGYRRAGLAARLLSVLIERREQAAIRAVLQPLEDRLSQTFAQLTGVPERRVWFDEQLAVQGIGARREEAVPFENQSRGAREQLLLALRAAIALEVTAAEGPQCLVLDDVLVHTDAGRHENVLDFLQQLSKKVQIVLLTCHAGRYRGAGHVVPVKRGDQYQADLFVHA